MARPYKTGLDYFDLDCYMDDKIKMMQAEFGLKGFAIVVKLFQVIYREQGYYCEWNKEKELLFAHEECSDCGVQLIQRIVAACIERRIFSKELFQKYGILTSNGIQKRYFNAVARRENVEVKKEYLLIKVTQKTVNVDKNRVNVNRNSVNERNNAQRRVEKSREENIQADAAPVNEEDDDGLSPEESYRIWKEGTQK